MIKENGMAKVLEDVSKLPKDSDITQEVIKQYALLKG